MEKLSDRLYNWASELDDLTRLQAEKTARLPIVEGHIALMPDAHLGVGSTVGSVIPTAGAVIPAAVGVDIGCGMIATKTTLTGEDLPDDLEAFMPAVRDAIPAGMGEGRRADRDTTAWMRDHEPASKLDSKQKQTALSQLGSLGGGNHFVEVSLDETGQVWLVLHSGSRGIGNQLAQAHIARARKLPFEPALEDPDLAYFMQGTGEFDHYIEDMLWAQDYAMANRQVMINSLLPAFFSFVGTGKVEETINCHHNFSQLEMHVLSSGVLAELWITRKGAIQARKGDRGIIPGSMGTETFIVKGLGNPASWNSCAHGAGRKMSRGQAKRTFTIDDLEDQMAGKVWLQDSARSLVDEIPSSYKDIHRVMNDQADLVEVEHTLVQILNYKGTK